MSNTYYYVKLKIKSDLYCLVDEPLGQRIMRFVCVNFYMIQRILSLDEDKKLCFCPGHNIKSVNWPFVHWNFKNCRNATKHSRLTLKYSRFIIRNTWNFIEFNVLHAMQRLQCRTLFNFLSTEYCIHISIATLN